jgi:hypothetical protein
VRIDNIAEYRRGKLDGKLAHDAAQRGGASYSIAYPRHHDDSYIAGWVAGWDNCAHGSAR